MKASFAVPAQGRQCTAFLSSVHRALGFAPVLAKICKSDHGPSLNLSPGLTLHFLVYFDERSRAELCRGDPRTVHLKPSQKENLHRYCIVLYGY